MLNNFVESKDPFGEGKFSQNVIDHQSMLAFSTNVSLIPKSGNARNTHQDLMYSGTSALTPG